jgi:hypothetical protein
LVRTAALASLALLLLTPLAHAAPTPVSASHRSSRTVGSRWIGGELRRSVTARHSGDAARVEVVTEARLRLLTGNFPVFRLRETSAGERLESRPLLRRGTHIDLLGGTTLLSVSKSLFQRSFKVKSVSFPVFAVGPFPVTVDAELGAYLMVNRKRELAWGDGPQAITGFEGVVRLGGSVEVGPSIVVAKVGVRGELDIIKASLPATATLHVDMVAFDVRFVLESRAQAKAFARIGVGPFSREWALDVPFLTWTFFRREVPIAHRELRYR